MHDTLVVTGGRRLSGDLHVPGFKHCLVTACAAALIGRATVRLDNAPDIEETRVLGQLFASLGAKVTRDDAEFAVDTGAVHTSVIEPELSAAIHGSVYLIPGLLSRFGRAVMPATGGCRLQQHTGRPVRHYVDVLARFGATVEADADGGLAAEAVRLHGTDIDLREFTDDAELRTGPLYSGATKMAILCASMAHGTTRLSYPYPKPDVTDLVEILRDMGTRIEYHGPDLLVVEGAGPDVLDSPVHHTIVTDLIEVVTWICMGVLTGSDLRLCGMSVPRVRAGLASEFHVLDDMGVRLESGETWLRPVVAEGELLRPVNVTVASTGVYSDSQPLLSLLATQAQGRSVFRETVWRGRFGHVPGLAAMGAAVTVADDGTLLVDGPRKPWRAGQRVHAGDLRAAASLVVAALAVPGHTIVDGCRHLARGYENLLGRLHGLGAVISGYPD
jgi:UDP-N-acetylglucosamine 1-carboxyvinyltransferase